MMGDEVTVRRTIGEGAVAKWQGEGLQSLYRRFDSAPRLQESSQHDPHFCAAPLKWDKLGGSLPAAERSCAPPGDASSSCGSGAPRAATP